MAKSTEYADEYRVSQRVVLRPGDKFRVRGGPYWSAAGGVKVSLTPRGPFTFVRHCKKGAVEWIDALDKDGSYSPLHIAGKRKRIDGRLVTRPYSVTGKKRPKKPRG